ncbi:amino acid permease-like protein [Nocardia pseudobrasiliensis]|uniref:Amino acid permease-like protein n=1 Tax=Nocardia pseudobrasiliensis TaxID=45979 RepID=A0A370I670_9NOCA|nr:amino acid permease-like protein [Nocardia pseudobrasiliensis]
MRNYLSWITLALMTTSSVASLRSAPTMAVYGLACVFLYLLPALLFLLPTAFVAAELASGWDGGVYKWVGEGLAKPLGFLAVWRRGARATELALSGRDQHRGGRTRQPADHRRPRGDHRHRIGHRNLLPRQSAGISSPSRYIEAGRYDEMS